LGDEQCGFIRAGAPDFAVRHQAAPDFPGLTGFGIFGVRPAINQSDTAAINDGTDGFMWTDAFLLGHQRQGAENGRRDNEEGFDFVHNSSKVLVVFSDVLVAAMVTAAHFAQRAKQHPRVSSKENQRMDFDLVCISDHVETNQFKMKGKI
jgi:hypothetical protein